jgi:RNA polymerase subunit RPABC4/transcription elongation factor Spt4
MTECIWCDEVYDSNHDTCPNCAVSTDTKGIKIIPLEDEDE